MVSSEQYTKYPQGSIWRKWDLHVHTPASIINHYGGNHDDIWERYISDLEGLPADFKVLGINDYWFLDGYKRLLMEKKQGRLSNIDLLLPVIEFRVDKLSGVEFNKNNNIDMHVIFSDELSPEVIRAQFLNRLSADFILDANNEDGCWSGAITDTSLDDLGRKIREATPEDKQSSLSSSNRTLGFNNLSLSLEKLKDILNTSSYLKEKYIVCIGKAEWDQLKWTSASTTIKKTLINFADIVFTSSPSIEQYHKAKLKLKEQGVNDLLLDCSDAHHFSDSIDKDRIGNCHTWIKADPTFEGLKQVIHEPENRVKIQELSPNVKANYDVIDRIEIQNNEVIGNKTIFLNPDLNVIIGGRSSGKSALLAGLACHLGCETYIRDNKYKRYIVNDFSKGFSVFFKGEEEPYSNDGEQKKIEYYAQNKFSELSKEQSDFNEIIAKIVSKDPEYHKISAYDSQRKALEKEIRQELEQCWALNLEVEEIQNNIKEMPSAHELNKQALILNDEYNSFGSGQLSEDDRNFYDELSKDKTYQEGRLLKLQSYSGLSDQLKQEPIVDTSLLKGIIDKTYFHTEDLEQFLTKKLEVLESEFKKNWLGHLKEFEAARIRHIEKAQKEINKINEDVKYKAILEKIKINSESERILNLLTSIRQQESNLIKLHDEVDLKCKEMEIKQKAIIRLFLQFFQQLKNLVDNFVIVPKSLNNQDSLKITLNISNKYDEYIKSLVAEKCDLRKLNAKIDLDIFGDYSSHKVHEKIYKFIQLIIKESEIVKGVNSVERIIEDILTRSWFDFNYDVEYEGDAFSEMSEGKKSFVMLKLILEFSDKRVPLLIDQPEDDLDNRAIFSELVQYLRMKKYDRQIILVTHNANVVINADSEMVIVANQHDTNSPNTSNVKFEYVQGSIEHSFPKDISKVKTLYTQGIKEHICEIMEGGTEAFKKREKRYNI